MIQTILFIFQDLIKALFVDILIHFQYFPFHWIFFFWLKFYFYFDSIGYLL